MTDCTLPDPIASVLSTWEFFLDARQAGLLSPLFFGLLNAHGRRTATAWFRPAGITHDFRRAYHLLGSLGRKTEIKARPALQQASTLHRPGTTLVVCPR